MAALSIEGILGRNDSEQQQQQKIGEMLHSYVT